jgi:uncharacterized damage-inducible protein DinB
MATQTLPDQLAQQLLSSQEYFNRSTRLLEEADSGYRPFEGMMSVAHQVTHTANTIDWFVQGVSRPEGFDLDFEKHAKAEAAVTSLGAARVMLEGAYRNAIAYVRSLTPEALAAPLPEGPILGGQPLSDVIWAIIDHCAHHRGALTAYSRGLGKTPPMPYMG